MQTKLVVTLTSLIEPPKSFGQPEQVTLVPEAEQAPHPAGQAVMVVVPLTLLE